MDARRCGLIRAVRRVNKPGHHQGEHAHGDGQHSALARNGKKTLEDGAGSRVGGGLRSTGCKICANPFQLVAKIARVLPPGIGVFRQTFSHHPFQR
jgi:hypothetical protein